MEKHIYKDVSWALDGCKSCCSVKIGLDAAAINSAAADDVKIACCCCASSELDTEAKLTTLVGSPPAGAKNEAGCTTGCVGGATCSDDERVDVDVSEDRFKAGLVVGWSW